MKRYGFSMKMCREAPDAQGGSPADTPPADTGPDLSFIPADFAPDGKPDLAAFALHYQDIAQKAAEYGERSAAVPDAYEFDLPDDFTPGDLPLPEGVTFGLDPKNEAIQPLLAEVSEVLKGLNAPATAAKSLMAILAKHEAIKESAKWQEFQADVEALGGQEKFTQRFSNVKRAIETKLSADDANAILSGSRISAGALKALEKLLAPKTMQPPTPKPQPVDPLAARYPRSA
jgi:hypothetical protein